MILKAPKVVKGLKLSQAWRTFSSKFEELRSSQDVVLSSSKNGVFVIGLNGQRNKNAFSNVFINNLCSTLDDLKQNEAVKVVIIRSMIKGVFCAGADLKERLEMTNQQVALFVGAFQIFYFYYQP
jgi:PREDICTED: enoyl coenzyme A hydratase domain containing 2